VKPRVWLLVLGVASLLLLCVCLASVGIARAVWWDGAASQLTSAHAHQELTLDLGDARSPTTPAKRETARLLYSTTLPQRDLVDLSQRLAGLPELLEVEPPSDPPEYGVGDEMAFWIHDLQTVSYYTTTATLRYETPHAYWWIEEDYEVATEPLERSAGRFETQTYPTGHRYFGSEWSPGVDGDPHVFIFLGRVPGAGGYFSVDDEYPAAVRPHSNQHEMFYINLDNAKPGSAYFDGILAHEFQHMIHFALDRDEDAWVNEGLSELAAQVSGYDVGGSDRAFSSAPDTQLTTWTALEDSAPHYGASYLFLAYFLEQYGAQAIRQLVAEPANGTAGFDAVLARMDPSGRNFAGLFADWLVANYADGISQAGSRHSYADLNIERPDHSVRHTSYPVNLQGTVHQYAADYILLQSEGDLTVEFTGTLTVPLVGNRTRRGEYMWWSNRGDDGDATLTRAFDLANLEEATLQAWTWYDLEPAYDYAYVEVSTDGGETWEPLANEHTTTANPSGNSYGPALTGTSGGRERPRWIRQRFDLSPYTGQAVLIRFEVITDEAVNHPGLCVDGVAIPELGYSDDAEAGTDGWRAEGWVRVTDHIPQDFLVQMISMGKETRVEQMTLDEQMRGAMTLTGLGRGVDRAVLVVSALAPATTEPAVYWYKITPE
jgi:immune inhibitor A